MANHDGLWFVESTGTQIATFVVFYFALITAIVLMNARLVDEHFPCEGLRSVNIGESKGRDFGRKTRLGAIQSHALSSRESAHSFSA